ncbi:hypothetical protein CFM97_00610 [Klebsiella michiganensis]|nr:hypothetical protein [Klebsiella michiganensis]
MSSGRESKNKVYPSYFKLHVCWLHSFTPVTYSCKLLGISSLAAFMPLELFRVKINLGSADDYMAGSSPR